MALAASVVDRSAGGVAGPGPRPAGDRRAGGDRHRVGARHLLRLVPQPAPQDRGPGPRRDGPRARAGRRRHLGTGDPEAADRRHAAGRNAAARCRDARRLIASLESTHRSRGPLVAVSGPPVDPPAEPRRVRQRHSRSAVARGRRGGAAAAGRARLRLRQHRRDAGRVAGAARALLRRGSRDCDAGGWRRVGRRRRAPACFAPRPTTRRTSTTTACRSARAAAWPRAPRCRSTAST